ncbi:hypothetical protein DFH09DRAFT_137920 [Mycena vulgaris]|nr:hypothetical protein DFH09DRAFT_137920 [Mycena vulgaris]
MPSFLDVEDIIEHVVHQLFLEERDDERGFGPGHLSKAVIHLALVSRKFLTPVRRNLYADLQILGPEQFLLLIGQLRVSPHLAKFVKHAWLYSGCSARTELYGNPDRDPKSVSSSALKCFLDACPQLNGLDIEGGDYLIALSSLEVVVSASGSRLGRIGLRKCDGLSSVNLSCTASLGRGWLKYILTLSGLKELDITDYALDGPYDPAYGILEQSSISSLRISCQYAPTSSFILTALLRSMHMLQELILDGMKPMPPGELKKCLDVVAPTLTFLSLTDYKTDEYWPQPWEDNTISGLHHLRELRLCGVPATASLLDMLPPRLEYITFSKNTMKFLPAPEIGSWLRRQPFPLGCVLKSLEFAGDFRANGVRGGPQASDSQVAELAHLCDALGIEWKHQGSPRVPEFDGADYPWPGL